MPVTYTTIPLQINGVNLTISTMHNNLTTSTKPPILFLHGFGSCKEDLADIAIHPSFQSHGYLAFDGPGCGHTSSNNLSATDIPFLVATASAVLSHFQITQFHLIGHSMGGLTALLLAHQHPTRVLSFIDIKGNLAPKTASSVAFMDAFITRTATAKSYGSPFYASTLRARVRSGAVRAIFESMVRLSDEEDLLGMFLNLSCEKMFMFGEENRGLSYLPRLGEDERVELAEIRESGHFPMYSNPVEMYKRIAGFLERVA
ncbi:alpha/beta-hydrolase [Aspergillus sclerotioniger CBS 115572]|uniref:Alpha/beta-hydrolase n=1 Tax=Aspergillus sclerotioniger CBS 115572 TaxID=1450535 RepID=A0A317VSL0_9EURO|nr:alpha/beta-hydrolase [Aspergillus sclerotioniger CBS 115572]PWY76017.1 alpha/beta-hydrolase [Aspergillus sclerotioniger CBS 115572]